MRARVCTLAYSGMAMAARMPMMATTIISSMRVKPFWFPICIRFLCQNLNMCSSLITLDRGGLGRWEVQAVCQTGALAKRTKDLGVGVGAGAVAAGSRD